VIPHEAPTRRAERTRRDHAVQVLGTHTAMVRAAARDKHAYCDCDLCDLARRLVAGRRRRMM